MNFMHSFAVKKKFVPFVTFTYKLQLSKEEYHLPLSTFRKSALLNIVKKYKLSLLRYLVRQGGKEVNETYEDLALWHSKIENRKRHT